MSCERVRFVVRFGSFRRAEGALSLRDKAPFAAAFWLRAPSLVFSRVRFEGVSYLTVSFKKWLEGEKIKRCAGLKFNIFR